MDAVRRTSDKRFALGWQDEGSVTSKPPSCQTGSRRFGLSLGILNRPILSRRLAIRCVNGEALCQETRRCDPPQREQRNVLRDFSRRSVKARLFDYAVFRFRHPDFPVGSTCPDGDPGNCPRAGDVASPTMENPTMTHQTQNAARRAGAGAPMRSVMMDSLLAGTILTSCEVTSLLLHYVLHDDA